MLVYSYLFIRSILVITISTHLFSLISKVNIMKSVINGRWIFYL